MRSHRLSLSRYWLALECAWWARPDVDYLEPPVGTRARVGNVVHYASHAYASASTEDVPVDGEWTPHELAEGKALFRPLKNWLDEWKSDNAMARISELRLRLDVETMQVHTAPRRNEPGYTRPGPTEVTGELDLLRDYGGWGRIEDVKSGKPRYVHDEQLRAYAVLARAFFGWERVEAAFVFTKKRSVEVTPYIVMSADDIDAEAGRLRRVLRTLPTAEPNPGEHCWSCDAKRAGVCPAHQEPSESDRDAAFAAF